MTKIEKTVSIILENNGTIDTGLTKEAWEELSNGDKADLLKEAILENIGAYAYFGDEYLNMCW